MVQRFGVDVHFHHAKPGTLEWIQTLGIKTVIDIGANVGQFEDEIREIIPNVESYAFEPLADCFTQLEKKANEESRFHIFPYALGNHDGKMLMHKHAYTPSSSLLQSSIILDDAFPEKHGATSETIEIRKLDDILSSRNLQEEILINIDVQGYEAEAIAGGRETFAKTKLVIIESSFVSLYKGQPLFADIHKLLSGLGFSYCGSWREKRHPKTGEILFEDSLYLKL